MIRYDYVLLVVSLRFRCLVSCVQFSSVENVSVTLIKACPRLLPKTATLYPETGDFVAENGDFVSGVAVFGNKCGLAITKVMTAALTSSNSNCEETVWFTASGQRITVRVSVMSS